MAGCEAEGGCSNGKRGNSSRHSSILDIIDRIEKTGEVLGDRALFLSDLIATIDDRLRDMPGKVEASASGDDFRLSFDAETRGRFGCTITSAIELTSANTSPTS